MERLSQDGVDALVDKLTRQSQALDEKERTFAVQALKAGASTESDEVSGYGMFVAEAVEQRIASDGDSDITLNGDEFQALLSKLKGMTGQFTPEERAYVINAFRHGVTQNEPSGEVQGYGGYPTPLYNIAVNHAVSNLGASNPPGSCGSSGSGGFSTTGWPPSPSYTPPNPTCSCC